MTGPQQLHALLLFGPLVLVFAAELVLLFARPSWLARLAFLPLGTSRRLVLEPAVRAALARSASYREASAGALDLSALAQPPALDAVGLRVLVDPDGTIATFRLPLGRMFALSGACCVQIHVERTALTLRARVMPTLAPTCAALLLPLVIMALVDASPEGPRVVAPVLGSLFVLFQGVGALRTRADFRSHVDGVLDALERRVAALA